MPGHISVANDRANFSGCRFVKFYNGQPPSGLEEEDELRFLEELTKDMNQAEGEEKLDRMSDVDYINAYFATRANLLVLEKESFEGMTAITITTQLDEDDIEEMTEFQSIAATHMEEFHQKRWERKEAERAAILENKRLIQVGKDAEAHNLKGQLRAALEKQASLQRQLADLEADDES